MRDRAVLWRVVVVGVWVVAVAGLAVLDAGNDGPYLYYLVGIPLTVLVGLIVDRWWAAAVPYAVSLPIAVWLVVGDVTCADCTDGEGPGLWITILLAVFAVPASGLLVVGVIARRLGRFFRNLPSDGQHA